MQSALYSHGSEQAKWARPKMTEKGSAPFLKGDTQNGGATGEGDGEAGPRPKDEHAR